MENNGELTRPKFLSNSALGAIGAAGFLASCVGTDKKGANLRLPEMLNEAPDGKILKAGLIGCGGRGTVAAINFLEAGPNLQIVALGDLFQDKLDACRDKRLCRLQRNTFRSEGESDLAIPTSEGG